MQLVADKITIAQLKQMAEKMFGNLVKAVVDVEKELLVVDAELHADQEAFLLAEGSAQQHLWGINLYPENSWEDLVEFDSMINIKPMQGNRSRGVNDALLRKKIIGIVGKKVVQ